MRWATQAVMRSAPIVIACSLATAAPAPAAAQTRLASTWVVDPARPGRDAPPVGRSLFDFAVTREVEGRAVYDVPFPFERLVKHLEARAGCKHPCAKQVLIPLGRSLQRTAAAPAFFEFPRVVAAIDVEPARPGAPLLKDRIYVGYQEKSDLVEVISYNEAAGRFEFQVVRDYREGGAREVVYARRAMCAACHQNLAPLFSRQVWEETNANPRIAALVARAGGDGGRERTDYQGVPIHRGVDVPNAIDAATDRANLLGVWQLLWRVGCGDGDAGARCRGAALAAALQYRLTDERAFDERSPAWRDELLPAFGRAWSARWPAGIAIPNPDIPNRDALPPEGARPVAGLAAAHVPAAFEPLAPRAPLEVWADPGPEAARRLGRARRVHHRGRIARARPGTRGARRRANVRPSSAAEAPCEITWTGASARFRCVGPALRRCALRAGSTFVARASRAARSERSKWTAPRRSSISRSARARSTRKPGARPWPSGHGVRAHGSPTAARSRGIALAWKPSEARARGAGSEVSARVTVTTVDDFAPVRAAIAALAGEPGDEAPLAARTFSRTRVLAPLFARLGVPAREWCCEDAARLPPVAVEAPEPPMPVDGAAAQYAAFYPLCASCHATAERSPPNFLAGPPERVAATREALRAAHLRAARAVAGRAAGARQDADAAAVRVGRAGKPTSRRRRSPGLERTASDLRRRPGRVPSGSRRSATRPCSLAWHRLRAGPGCDASTACYDQESRREMSRSTTSAANGPRRVPSMNHQAVKWWQRWFATWCRRVVVVTLAMIVILVLYLAQPFRRTTGRWPMTTSAEHFKYGSTGGERESGFPYWILKAMPEVCAQHLPGREGYHRSG